MPPMASGGERPEEQVRRVNPGRATSKRYRTSESIGIDPIPPPGAAPPSSELPHGAALPSFASTPPRRTSSSMSPSSSSSSPKAPSSLADPRLCNAGEATASLSLHSPSPFRRRRARRSASAPPLLSLARDPTPRLTARPRLGRHPVPRLASASPPRLPCSCSLQPLPSSRTRRSTPGLAAERLPCHHHLQPRPPAPAPPSRFATTPLPSPLVLAAGERRACPGAPRACARSGYAR
nr:serine/arginine repetitive matrix protein 1-like [Aegilops tauschii subsp. strangulata]